jgi:hypothetical protein
VVRDMVLVPAEALGRATRVELGLRPFPQGEGAWLLPATRLDAGPLFLIEKPNP